MNATEKDGKARHVGAATHSIRVMKPIHCSLLVAALAPACVASDLGDPSTSTTTAAVGLPGGGGKGYGDGTNCPSWGCGTNSPVIGP